MAKKEDKQWDEKSKEKLEKGFNRKPAIVETVIDTWQSLTDAEKKREEEEGSS